MRREGKLNGKNTSKSRHINENSRWKAARKVKNSTGNGKKASQNLKTAIYC